MTKKILCTLLSSLMVLLFASFSFAQKQSEPPKVGAVLPEMELTKPKDTACLQYLGLSSGGSVFKIDQLRTKIVIIEIFSMYCPYCQAEAPNINKLYQLLESRPELKSKIKIIGIGAGNTQFEVATFKRKYTVSFPLIPDEDFKLHKILGEPRTPYFIVVKLNDKKQQEVIYSKLGALENIDLFLARIIRLAGLQ